MQQTRLDMTFKHLSERNSKAFLAFISAGDPDPITSLEIMKGLPGGHIIELGMLHRPNGGWAVYSSLIAKGFKSRHDP